MGLARDFYSSWKDVITDRQAEVFEHWESRTAFTNFIIKSDDSVLLDISKKIGFECYNKDYYHIDAVFYKQEDLLPEFSEGCYLANIRIAFEHENDFNSGLFQEVSHLLQVNSELKVLVSYPKNSEVEAQELQKLHYIISKSRQAAEIATNEGFLIIMGHGEPYEWKGWLYDSRGWINITA